METRVIKLGGSLLDLPDLRSRMFDWLASLTPANNLILVGGGELVESMRSLDSLHRFDPSWVHWRCVELLSLTHQIVQQLVPEFDSIDDASQLSEFVRVTRSQPMTALVQCVAFYNPMHPDERLPEHWETTTDSLSCLLAEKVDAEELLLLKSTSASDENAEPALWRREGLVDAAFEAVAGSVEKIRLVNFRDLA